MNSSSKEPPAIDADALLADRAQEINRAMGAPTQAERAADLSEKRRQAAFARWGSQTPRGETSRIRIDPQTCEKLRAEFGDNAGRALKFGAEWALNHAQEIKTLLSSLALAAFLPLAGCAQTQPPKTEILHRDDAQCLLCQLGLLAVVDWLKRGFCDFLRGFVALHNSLKSLSAHGEVVSPRPFAVRRARICAARLSVRRSAHHVNPCWGLA